MLAMNITIIVIIINGLRPEITQANKLHLQKLKLVINYKTISGRQGKASAFIHILLFSLFSVFGMGDVRRG